MKIYILSFLKQHVCAAIIKESKNREGMIFKYFNHQAMTTMVINGKLKYLMQSLKNVIV